MEEEFIRETKKWREEVDVRLRAGDERMTAIEALCASNTRELTRNTELTNGVKTDTAGLLEAWNAARGGFKVLEQLGRLSKGIAVIAVIGGVLAIGVAKLRTWLGI